MATRAPLPGTITYSKLSPAAVEALTHIRLRVTAGWTTEEIATEFNRSRPPFRHMYAPRTFTMSWVNGQMRNLKEEMLASVDPDS